VVIALKLEVKNEMMGILIMETDAKEIEQQLSQDGYAQEDQAVLLILELNALQDFIKIVHQTQRVVSQYVEMDLKLLEKNEMMVTLSIMMGAKATALQLRQDGFDLEDLQPRLTLEHNEPVDFIKIILLIQRIESLSEEMDLK